MIVGGAATCTAPFFVTVPPPVFVTVTLVAFVPPVAALLATWIGTAICVELVKTTGPVVVNPVLLNVTVAPRAKFVPVMVSVTSEPWPTDDGVTVATVGAPTAVTVNVGVSRSVVLPDGIPWPVTVTETAVLESALLAVAGEMSLTGNVSIEIAPVWLDQPASGFVSVTVTEPPGALFATVTDTVPEVPPPPTVTAPNVTPLEPDAEATTPDCMPVPVSVTEVVVPTSSRDGDALVRAGAATIANGVVSELLVVTSVSVRLKPEEGADEADVETSAATVCAVPSTPVTVALSPVKPGKVTVTLSVVATLVTLMTM